MGESFVVDNSIVMSWCFKDESNPSADSVLDRLAESSALVPSHWPLEVVNVLLVAERSKRLSQTDGERFLSLLTQLPIIIEGECPATTMKDLFSLGRAHKLSSYDACYLELAIRKGLPLATLDRGLRKAARSANVPLFPES